MEDSITKYLTLCQAPEFAVRATLFDGLCLKQQGMFNEAATSYIRLYECFHRKNISHLKFKNIWQDDQRVVRPEVGHAAGAGRLLLPPLLAARTKEVRLSHRAGRIQVRQYIFYIENNFYLS